MPQLISNWKNPSWKLGIVQRGKVHFLFQYDCGLVHKAWLDEFGEKEPHSSTNTEHTELEERLQATNISLGRHKWPCV